MMDQVNIAVTATDVDIRNFLVKSIEIVEQVRVSPYPFDDASRIKMLASKPDVIVCVHDGSHQNCQTMEAWLEEQAKARRVMTLLIIDPQHSESVSPQIERRMDQVLHHMPDAAELQRNVSLLVRLVRSENEVMQSMVLNEALKVSENKYRTIVNSLEDGYFEVDEHGRFRFLNDSMARILTSGGLNVVGRRFDEVLAKESSSRFEKLLEMVRTHHNTIRGERWEVKTDGGHYRVVELSLMPSGDAAFHYVRGLARDVTSIEAIELEIAKKEEHFRTAINSKSEALYLLKSLRNDDGRIIDFVFTEVNQAGYDMLAMPSDKVIGAALCELLPVNKDPRFFDKYVKVVENRQILDEEYQIDVEYYKPRWAHHTVVPLEDGIAITVRDVTELKTISHKIEADRNLLHTIINAITDEIYLKDTDRRFVMVNRGVLNTLGKKSAEEVIGKRDEDLIDLPYLGIGIEQDQHVLQTGIPIINHEGFAYTDESQTEVRRSMLVSKFPYFDQEGNIVGLIGINRDITVRKRAELRIKKSLREKEVLLKEIHHRVKNNLAVISGLLAMQAENVDNEDVKQLLHESEVRIRSMAMIHEKLYHHDMYSGIEFGSYVKDLVSTISASYQSEGCEINVHLETPNTYIDLNRAMPCALIVNEALTNAYKHAFKGRNHGDIWINFSQYQGTYRMVIRDNGVGFPPGYDPEKVTTLGMTLIFGLVQQLGSKLYIESKNGTQFSFEFGGEEKAPW